MLNIMYDEAEASHKKSIIQYDGAIVGYLR
jgi:hypothetical protein